MKNALDQTFAALADGRRRRMVELLSERPCRAGELAEALKVPPPVVSRYLKQLKEADLVEETHPEFDARVRIYSIKNGAMEDLKAWIAATEALWTKQLAAFKRHLEKSGK